MNTATPVAVVETHKVYLISTVISIIIWEPTRDVTFAPNVWLNSLALILLPRVDFRMLMLTVLDDVLTCCGASRVTGVAVFNCEFTK